MSKTPRQQEAENAERFASVVKFLLVICIVLFIVLI